MLPLAESRVFKPIRRMDWMDTYKFPYSNLAYKGVPFDYHVKHTYSVPRIQAKSPSGAGSLPTSLIICAAESPVINHGCRALPNLRCT